VTGAEATRRQPMTGRPACLHPEGDAAWDCELCRGAGLCPQCDGYRCLPEGSVPGARCPLCAGESWCPQCTGTGEAEAVGP
jgi:hypothetical protein